jgi:hypothetical protein
MDDRVSKIAIGRDEGRRYSPWRGWLYLRPSPCPLYIKMDYALIGHCCAYPLSRFRQRIEFLCSFAHDAGAQCSRKLASSKIGGIPVPVRKVTGEHKHLLGVKHFQNRVEVPQVLWFLYRLCGEQNMITRTISLGSRSTQGAITRSPFQFLSSRHKSAAATICHLLPG